MKYKVTQKTEIRLNPSKEKGDVYDVLEPGFMVDIIQEIEESDSEDIWLEDTNGFY